MGLFRGALVGSLGLVALQAVTSSGQASGRVGGLFTTVAKGFDIVINPARPGLPDLRESANVASSVAASFTTSSPAATVAGDSAGGGVSSSPSAPDVSGASAAVAPVIAYARAQIGKPYKWAAAGPDSFDCSGLTMRAYQQIGINLAHWTGAQYLRGTKVASLSDALPGDLVFFGKGVPHHVGLYTGGGKMIAAPRTGLNVREQTVASSGTVTYIRRLVKAETKTATAPAATTPRIPAAKAV